MTKAREAAGAARGAARSGGQWLSLVQIIIEPVAPSPVEEV